MRVPRALLLTVFVAVLALPTAVGASTSSTVPSATYAWAQPGCAPVSTPYAQPPASILAAPIVVAAPPGSGYVWPQPDGPIVSVPCAQPVPTTS
jgi:hypothetical protein